MSHRFRSSLRWSARCFVLTVAACGIDALGVDGHDSSPPDTGLVSDAAAGDSGNDADAPTLIHALYRLSDHYEEVSRPIHPDIVEQHGLVRLPSPVNPLESGQVWDVTKFLRSKGLALPGNAFARIDTGNRTFALASNLADHHRLEELGEIGYSRRPKEAKLTLRVYRLDPDQHIKLSLRELLEVVERGEDPGFLLLESEQDTTPQGHLAWSFGSIPGNNQIGEDDADQAAAGNVAVHLTTNLRAGSWTTQAAVDFDGWFRLDLERETTRRRLRWGGFSEGPSDEWQGMRATVQDVDLLLLLRTTLQHPADLPPLLFSELLVRPQPGREPGPPIP